MANRKKKNNKKGGKSFPKIVRKKGGDNTPDPEPPIKKILEQAQPASTPKPNSTASKTPVKIQPASTNNNQMQKMQKTNTTKNPPPDSQQKQTPQPASTNNKKLKSNSTNSTAPTNNKVNRPTSPQQPVSPPQPVSQPQPTSQPQPASQPNQTQQTTSQPQTNSQKPLEWYTYLAYQKSVNNETPETMMKYEAFLCQCAYLSRMAYCPADIFCRMTQHLDLTPNAFNNYIRAIEKIYGRLFNYRCSYNSLWVRDQPSYKQYFKTTEITLSGNPIGYFIRNDNKLNMYIYKHHNKDSKFNADQTIFVVFKGSSSMSDFIHDLKSQFSSDAPLSEIFSKKQGKAGKGFLQMFNTDILQKIASNILELSTSTKKIIITGHSLGGALASIFGFWLRTQDSFLMERIHIITFGEPTIFNPVARNEFNELLSITGNNIFTYDRIDDVTILGGISTLRNVVTTIPIDLNHPGYSLLKTEVKAYSKTGRTNQIKELRKTMGMTGASIQKNDYLTCQDFVNLFSNSKDFNDDNGNFNENKYKQQYRVKFGSNKDLQLQILQKAMPDAKEDIKQLFQQIESIKQKQTNNQPNGTELQTMSKQSAGQLLNFQDATATYKKKTKTVIPNHVIYNCYKIMSGGFCHAVYMGVTFLTVLRVPGISGGFKAKKEPKQNYTLYKIGNNVISCNKNKDSSCDNSSPSNSNVVVPTTFGIKNVLGNIEGAFRCTIL